MLPAADREQEEGSSLRPPPSMRHEIWGILADYLQDVYRRGWEGRKTESPKIARCRKGATEIKRTEEQEWAVAPTSTNVAAQIPISQGAGGCGAIEH